MQYLRQTIHNRKLERQQGCPCAIATGAWMGAVQQREKELNQKKCGPAERGFARKYPSKRSALHLLGQIV